MRRPYQIYPRYCSEGDKKSNNLLLERFTSQLHARRGILNEWPGTLQNKGSSILDRRTLSLFFFRGTHRPPVSWIRTFCWDKRRAAVIDDDRSKQKDKILFSLGELVRQTDGGTTIHVDYLHSLETKISILKCT